MVDTVKADGSTLDPWKWLEEKSLSSSMAHYWSFVINLQIELFVFVRSVREDNFHLYVQLLRSLLKCFFALDRTNYARWFTTHVFVLISLPTAHPDVYRKKLKGFSSFAKTKDPSSRMALYQVHERNNKIIKGLAGATGILNTQDESALIRWETCGPEVARIVSEFEDSSYDQEASRSADKHHEDNEKFRQKFNRDFGSAYQAIPCNSFDMASFSTLNNSSPLPQSVSDQLKQAMSTGERQVKVFIQDRLLMQKTVITEKISMDKFPLLNVGFGKEQITGCRLGINSKVLLNANLLELMNCLEKSFTE